MDNKIIYIVLIIVFVILVLRFGTQRYFKLEFTEDLVSITYDHLIIKRNKASGLKLPWSKIQFCKLERGIFSHYICIGVLGKRRNKVFYYNLGVLSISSLRSIEVCLINVKNVT
jgi:hypothetical protein